MCHLVWSALYAVKYGTPMQAPSLKLMESGKGRVSLSGAATYSAYPPLNVRQQVYTRSHGLKISKQTRKHSSRMRTARFSNVGDSVAA